MDEAVLPARATKQHPNDGGGGRGRETQSLGLRGNETKTDPIIWSSFILEPRMTGGVAEAVNHLHMSS